MKSEEELPGRGDIAASVLARDGELRRTFRLEDLVVHDDEKEKNAARRRKEELESTLVGATLVVDARFAGLKDERICLAGLRVV